MPIRSTGARTTNTRLIIFFPGDIFLGRCEGWLVGGGGTFVVQPFVVQPFVVFVFAFCSLLWIARRRVDISLVFLCLLDKFWKEREEGRKATCWGTL